jgi:hypothetical protein
MTLVSQAPPSRCIMIGDAMGFPIKTCVVCGEEFELKPGKPGFANRCLDCTEEDAAAKAETIGSDGSGGSAIDRRVDAEMNAARRGAIRDLLYRKDS